MEMIIKPTSECNFNCSFCAASQCKIPTLTKVPDELKRIILKAKPSTIIFTGGEPTMCPPSFYDEILDITKDMNTSISLTSNLANLRGRYAEWSHLLKNNRFAMTVSFQYGDARRDKHGNVYTEDQFRLDIMEFRFWARYTPSFISVIDYDNTEYALDLVKLAKELGTVAKLNNCNAIGNATKWLPRYEMFKIYFQIIEAGYGDYEENILNRKMSMCPLNTDLLCESKIRALYIDKYKDIRWSNCEEELNSLNDRAFVENCFFCDKGEQNPTETVTDHCYTCELFRICNGCKINVRQAKQDPEYCRIMTEIKDDIIKYGWKL